jgi:tetratricopeptide (TPR) repeat protein
MMVMKKQLPSNTRRREQVARYGGYLAFMTVCYAVLLHTLIDCIAAGEYPVAVCVAAVILFGLRSSGALFVSLPLYIYFWMNYSKPTQNFSAMDLTHRRALNLLKKLPVKKSTSMVTILSNLALLRMCQGQYESAAQLFSEAVVLVEKSKRLSSSAAAVVVYSNLAAVLVRLKRYVEAETYASKAVEIAQSPTGQKRFAMFVGPPLGVLGAVHYHFGELQASRDFYLRAMEAYDSLPAALGYSKATFDHSRLFAMLSLALVSQKLGDAAESRKYCDQVLHVAMYHESQGNPLALQTMNDLADEYIASAELERAEKLLDISYSIGRTNPFHPDAQKTLDCYAQLLETTGRKSEIADMRSWLRGDLPRIPTSPAP